MPGPFPYCACCDNSGPFDFYGPCFGNIAEPISAPLKSPYLFRSSSFPFVQPGDATNEAVWSHSPYAEAWQVDAKFGSVLSAGEIFGTLAVNDPGQRVYYLRRNVIDNPVSVAIPDLVTAGFSTWSYTDYSQWDAGQGTLEAKLDFNGLSPADQATARTSVSAEYNVAAFLTAGHVYELSLRLRFRDLRYVTLTAPGWTNLFNAKATVDLQATSPAFAFAHYDVYGDPSYSVASNGDVIVGYKMLAQLPDLSGARIKIQLGSTYSDVTESANWSGVAGEGDKLVDLILKDVTNAQGGHDLIAVDAATKQRRWTHYPKSSRSWNVENWQNPGAPITLTEGATPYVQWSTYALPALNSIQVSADKLWRVIGGSGTAAVISHDVNNGGPTVAMSGRLAGGETSNFEDMADMIRRMEIVGLPGVYGTTENNVLLGGRKYTLPKPIVFPPNAAGKAFGVCTPRRDLQLYGSYQKNTAGGYWQYIPDPGPYTLEARVTFGDLVEILRDVGSMLGRFPEQDDDFNYIPGYTTAERSYKSLEVEDAAFYEDTLITSNVNGATFTIDVIEGDSDGTTHAAIIETRKNTGSGNTITATKLVINGTAVESLGFTGTSPTEALPTRAYGGLRVVNGVAYYVRGVNPQIVRPSFGPPWLRFDRLQLVARTESAELWAIDSAPGLPAFGAPLFSGGPGVSPFQPGFGVIEVSDTFVYANFPACDDRMQGSNPPPGSERKPTAGLAVSLDGTIHWPVGGGLNGSADPTANVAYQVSVRPGFACVRNSAAVELSPSRTRVDSGTCSVLP